MKLDCSDLDWTALTKKFNFNYQNVFFNGKKGKKENEILLFILIQSIIFVLQMISLMHLHLIKELLKY